MTFSPADMAFVRHKARSATLNVCRHLVSLRTAPKPYAVPGSPSRGGTAVIVGAGPSLPSRLDLVAEMQAAGALVFCVNASLPALAQAGITADVCCVRESVSVGSHLDHPCALVVSDLAACDGAWERAGAFFVGAYLQTFEIAARLGVRPLYAGTSALTSAAALAEAWGASRLVLVGTDLAFAKDGTGYAPGSAWEGYHGTRGGDGRMELGGAGYAAMVEQSASAGIAPPPPRQDVYPVESYGGSGTVLALGTWVDQIRWLATFAERRGTAAGSIECFNATGIGARIAGWREASPGPAGVWGERALRPADPTAAIEDIRRQVQMAGDMMDTVMHPNGAPTCVPGFLDGHDTIDAAAAGDLMAALEGVTDPRQAVEAVAGAYREAARAVGEVVGG